MFFRFFIHPSPALVSLRHTQYFGSGCFFSAVYCIRCYLNGLRNMKWNQHTRYIIVSVCVCVCNKDFPLYYVRSLVAVFSKFDKWFFALKHIGEIHNWTRKLYACLSLLTQPSIFFLALFWVLSQFLVFISVELVKWQWSSICSNCDDYSMLLREKCPLIGSVIHLMIFRYFHEKVNEFVIIFSLQIIHATSCRHKTHEAYLNVWEDCSQQARNNTNTYCQLHLWKKSYISRVL